MFFNRESKAKKKNYTIIIGCGRLGATIASTLSDMGKNVLIVDTNEDSFRKLSSNYGGQVLVGDATDYGVLKEARVDEASVVIPVTHSDNTNIMISQMIKHKYESVNVIARLYDPERDVVYKEFGIDTIYPAYLESNQVMKWYGGGEEDE